MRTRPELTSGSFVAENWQYGWIGQFMWKVLSTDLGLRGQEIVAMTTLNFTGATDPRNATSVYKGASAFTRCVWEINLGNVVRGAARLRPIELESHLSRDRSKRLIQSGSPQFTEARLYHSRGGDSMTQARLNDSRAVRSTARNPRVILVAHALGAGLKSSLVSCCIVPSSAT